MVFHYSIVFYNLINIFMLCFNAQDRIWVSADFNTSKEKLRSFLSAKIVFVCTYKSAWKNVKISMIPRISRQKQRVWFWCVLHARTPSERKKQILANLIIIHSRRYCGLRDSISFIHLQCFVCFGSSLFSLSSSWLHAAHFFLQTNKVI